MQRFAQASGSTSENTDCQAEKACAADASQMDTTTSLSELTDRNAPWRQEIRKAMKPKERTAIPRVVMPELDPVYRATTRTEEVNIGLSAEQAMTEARRCLDCANPTCMQGCPVSINIPSFIKNIERGEFLNAARVLKSTSALPAVCGRVCPQEKQCEKPVHPPEDERTSRGHRLSGTLCCRLRTRRRHDVRPRMCSGKRHQSGRHRLPDPPDFHSPATWPNTGMT